MIKRIKITSFVMLSLAAIANCCADNKIFQLSESLKNKSQDSGEPQQTIIIQFAAKVGNEDFDCSTANYANIGTANSVIVPKDFRFYIHDLRLVKFSGSEVPVKLTQDNAYQYQNLAFLDFENAAPGTLCDDQGDVGTHTKVSGTIPASESLNFTKIRFKLGVPQNLNQNGATGQPAPLNVTYMFWSWTTGYKHAVVEFNVGSYTPFFTHLGSIDCDTFASPPDITCATSNRPEIELNFQYGDTIVADAKLLYQGLDLSIANAGGTQPGCHSDRNDPDCKTVLNNWGVDFHYTGTSTSRGMTASSPASPTLYSTAGQTFFRVD